MREVPQRDCRVEAALQEQSEVVWIQKDFSDASFMKQKYFFKKIGFSPEGDVETVISYQTWKRCSWRFQRVRQVGRQPDADSSVISRQPEEQEADVQPSSISPERDSGVHAAAEERLFVVTPLMWQTLQHVELASRNIPPPRCRQPAALCSTCLCLTHTSRLLLLDFPSQPQRRGGGPRGIS